jgi:integrase/recombinase XerD
VTTVTADQLARDAQEFLRFKRAMGIAYWRGEFVLNGFLRFVAQHWGDHGEVALDDAITRWCARIAGRKAVTVANEFGAVRQLCLYRRRRDPSSYVPEHALAPVKESIFLPYIFSHDEVHRILAAATSHHGRFIWASMLRALILVLYCTGLRLGEAVRLRAADVDLDRSALMIQRSKGRSRIAAIRADLVAELRRYAAERRRLVGERRRTDPETFFLRLDASPLTVGSACCGTSASSHLVGASARAHTSSATPLPCIDSRLGPTRVSISTPSCRCCRRISATRTSSAPRSI